MDSIKVYVEESTQIQARLDAQKSRVWFRPINLDLSRKFNKVFSRSKRSSDHLDIDRIVTRWRLTLNLQLLYLHVWVEHSQLIKQRRRYSLRFQPVTFLKIWTRFLKHLKSNLRIKLIFDSLWYYRLCWNRNTNRFGPNLSSLGFKYEYSVKARPAPCWQYKNLPLVVLRKVKLMGI